MSPAALGFPLLAGLSLLVGCETTAGRCTFTACGGGPELLRGQWTVKDHCPAPQTRCSAARADYSDVTVEGTVLFDEQGRYAVSLRQRGTVVATVPLSCYPAAAGCAGVQTALEAELAAQGGARVALVRCSGEAVCTCRESLAPDPVAESGLYQLSEARVILTSGGEATTHEYCAASQELRLRATTGGAADVLVLRRVGAPTATPGDPPRP